jgi:hypothetical protein
MKDGNSLAADGNRVWSAGRGLDGQVPTVGGRRQVFAGVMTRRRVAAKSRVVLVAKRFLVGAVIALALVGASGGAASAGSGAVQIGGIGRLDSGQVCDRGVEEVFSPLVMTGDLNGCWYTDSFTGTSRPSGAYQETGAETFIGCLADGTTCGTFSTTYQFHAKFAPDGSEIFGRCQHPIVPGSGTEGFTGISGRVDFKDDVDAGLFNYRGHLKGIAASTSIATASATTGSVSSGC